MIVDEPALPDPLTVCVMTTLELILMLPDAEDDAADAKDTVDGTWDDVCADTWDTTSRSSEKGRMGSMLRQRLRVYGEKMVVVERKTANDAQRVKNGHFEMATALPPDNAETGLVHFPLVIRTGSGSMRQWPSNLSLSFIQDPTKTMRLEDLCHVSTMDFGESCWHSLRQESLLLGCYYQKKYKPRCNRYFCAHFQLDVKATDP